MTAGKTCSSLTTGITVFTATMGTELLLTLPSRPASSIPETALEPAVHFWTSIAMGTWIFLWLTMWNSTWTTHRSRIAT